MSLSAREKEYRRQYRIKNAEKLRLQRILDKPKRDKWIEDNKERLSKQRKEYRSRNIDKIKEYDREYSNRKEVKIKRCEQRKRRYAKNAAMFTSNYYIDPSQPVLNKIRGRFSKICSKSIPIWYEADIIRQLYIKRIELNKLYNLKLEVDHIIPLNPRDKSVCGLHCWANLQLLSQELNKSKRDKYNTDW